MRSKVKNFVKGIVTLVVVVAVFFVANRILILKSEDGYDQMRSYYKQTPNTVDVVFVGSSKVYCQIDTGVIWDEYGISSFDLGGSEATTWNSYYFLKEALKTQKPKVIVYDASILACEPDVEFQELRWVKTNNYGMKWNENRIRQLRANTDGAEDFYECLIPFNTMHSRYNDLTENDFRDVNDDISYKGFDFRDAVTPLEETGITSISGEIQISPKHQEYLLKMIELAKAESVPFVVIVTPHVLTEESAKIYNYVERICQENGVEFLNLNQKYDEIGIDFATDYAEELHLNFSGTMKLSKYLGNYVHDKFELVDHRGDNKYASWERDALINRQNRACYNLNQVETYEEVSNYFSNDNYLVFDVNEKNEVTIYSGGKELLYVNGENETKATIDLDNKSINFYRDANKTRIKMDDDEIKIGWPWSTVVVYDMVLDRLIFEKRFYERVIY